MVLLYWACFPKNTTQVHISGISSFFFLFLFFGLVLEKSRKNSYPMMRGLYCVLVTFLGFFDMDLIGSFILCEMGY